MPALRRAIDWAFRDRRTGALVIGQWPNLPLWLFFGFSAARWVLASRGDPDRWLRIGAGLALAWWAADEVLRGANPWRRLLGSAALAWLAVSTARTLTASNLSPRAAQAVALGNLYASHKLVVASATISVDHGSDQRVSSHSRVRIRPCIIGPRTKDTMADMGISYLMQDESRSSSGLQVLDRIAAVLDVPVSDFYRHDADSGEGDVPSASECQQVLTAFLRVRDPEARLRIIDMMRAHSND